MGTDLTISEARIATHIRELAEGVGVRLTGSAAEQRATDYVAAEFRRAGAAVTLEPFSVRERHVQREELHIRLEDTCQAFPCSLFAGAPGTGGRSIEAPLLFFESPAEYRRPDLAVMRGRAVVHLGCHIESREQYRRLMDAKPAFLLFVDVRYPGTVPLADGLFPSYVQTLGAVPTMNVAFMDAWNWKVGDASAARLLVDGGMRDSTSRNVVADLAGTDPDAGLLILCAHHDTQAASAGADDNASGVAALLELARVLAPRKRRRGIRLISFGAEEQLSVGSAAYVREHRRELESRGRFVFNIDSSGSHLGWNTLTLTGSPEMRDTVLPLLEQSGLYAQPVYDTVPYLDQFPFAAAGVPGISLTRNNCATGRFFHHRPDDNTGRVSTTLLAAQANAAARLVEFLAQADDMPFPAEIPPDQAAPVATFWEDLFGGWE